MGGREKGEEERRGKNGASVKEIGKEEEEGKG